MPRKYPPELFPQGDGFIGEALVPRHHPLPESVWEESTFDGSPDPSVIKESIDVLDVLVRACCSIIGSQCRQLL